MSDDAKTPKKSARWLRLALFASLAANLAVVGVVLGAVLLRPPFDRAGPPHGRDFVFPYTRAFDEGQRRELGRNLRGAFERDRARAPMHGGLLGGYRAALDVLRAEPFDPQAFSAALDAQSARAEARQAAGQRVLIDYVASLPPEARVAYADRLEAEIDEMAERFQKYRR
ncbi:periplasmic heavy metal sensor [Salipiger abyssi]|uniref:periplasmic heavy metal sensor n=1 Tax=Salipiger abyssi TaxID=1250539 RepID=UPI001A8F35C1|nr:periplasmic heavy metal sensor [Salipiger abyssi]MBN9888329.1 periplasmic heavy metal sensor [Salipiger abyssi]